MAAAMAMALIWPTAAGAGEQPRFFYSGDGRLHLAGVRSGQSFKGVYRDGVDRYQPEALRAIRAAFDAPAEDSLAAISLRLIEFIDFLQDHFNPDAVVRISSGWRSPEYNTRLRRTGSLAATASLHQYGMAADIEIEGVASRRIWDFVRRLEFGGAGYYHGELVHVDVGPARSWDENTSGVGTGISDDNKLIGLTADFDRYRPGEEIILRFIRMTAFPIGVSTEWKLSRQPQERVTPSDILFQPAFPIKNDLPCPHFGDIGQMMNIRWRLPQNLPPGRYKILAFFCERISPVMPDQVETAAFEVMP